MAWRVAASLEVLLGQINSAAPNRSKISDGSIGDADHANRTSDHNPWCDGHVVTARDFTHDPDAGADMVEIAEALRQSRDPRIKYVIFQGRMFSSYGSQAWEWRSYSGVNAHANHMHISVQCDGSKDSRAVWEIGDWLDMASEEQVRKIVREEVQRAVHQLATGKEENWNKKYMNLKQVEQRLKKSIEGK